MWVIMFSACSHGDVRLVGGSTTIYYVEGRVELCVFGEWKRVCASIWDSTFEGAVVCRQLGCTDSK